MPLNQQPVRNNQVISCSTYNRRFDKQRRKCSFRGGGGGRSKPNNFHSTHCPIDLSSR